MQTLADLQTGHTPTGALGIDGMGGILFLSAFPDEQQGGKVPSCQYGFVRVCLELICAPGSDASSQAFILALQDR